MLEEGDNALLSGVSLVPIQEKPKIASLTALQRHRKAERMVKRDEERQEKVFG